jgi:PII-like signaling protein
MDSTILRIYMPVRAKRKGKLTFWQKFSGASLSSYLLNEAKSFGIEQAIFQRSSGGYLKGQKLVFDLSEVAPLDLPQVVELVDKEDRLRAFIAKFKDHVTECKVVLFKTSELIK